MSAYSNRVCKDSFSKDVVKICGKFSLSNMLGQAVRSVQR